MRRLISISVVLTILLVALSATTSGIPPIQESCNEHVNIVYYCTGTEDYYLAKRCTINDVYIDGVLHYAGCTHIEYYYGTVKDCLDCLKLFERPSAHLCIEDMPALGIWIDWCENSLMEYN